MTPIFEEVLQAREWQGRQASLARAYEVAARMHNDLNITILLREEAAQHFGRPYLVVGDDRYAEELRKVIKSEEVRKINHNLGSVNQMIDSNIELNDPLLCKRLKEMYE